MGSVFNKISELFVKLKDGAGNLITSTDLGSGKRGLDIYGTITATIDKVRLRDKTNETYMAKVDSTGNLYFVTPTPEVPAGKTSISDIRISSVTGTAYSFIVIPDGASITIQRFKGGAQNDVNGGSRVGLYYSPDGTSSGMTLLEVLYANGSSSFVDLGYTTPVGNGTRAICIERKRLAGGSVEIFGKWEGYY